MEAPFSAIENMFEPCQKKNCLFEMWEQVRLKPACSAATEASKNIRSLDIEAIGNILSRQRITMVLIWLRGCTGWSDKNMFFYDIVYTNLQHRGQSSVIFSQKRTDIVHRYVCMRTLFLSVTKQILRQIRCWNITQVYKIGYLCGKISSFSSTEKCLDDNIPSICNTVTDYVCKK